MVLAEELLSLNAAFPFVVLLTFAMVAEALRCRQSLWRSTEMNSKEGRKKLKLIDLNQK